MQEQKTPKKPLIYYAYIALVVLIFLECPCLPHVFHPNHRSGLQHILNQVQNHQVTKAEVSDTQIAFYRSGRKRQGQLIMSPAEWKILILPNPI